jgi:hypothetical protein
MEAEIGDLHTFIRASINRQNKAQEARLARDRRDNPQ